MSCCVTPACVRCLMETIGHSSFCDLADKDLMKARELFTKRRFDTNEKFWAHAGRATAFF